MRGKRCRRWHHVYDDADGRRKEEGGRRKEEGGRASHHLLAGEGRHDDSKHISFSSKSWKERAHRLARGRKV